MFINNSRWDGVPFLLKAGKALKARTAEIRVQFRHVPGNLYAEKLAQDLDRAANELVSPVDISKYLGFEKEMRVEQRLIQRNMCSNCDL